jgi:D-alanine-D-alanine ligase
MTQAQKMAADAFTTLECEGMARVDLFLDQDTGHWTFNELNTLPGFTQISMYPKLWEASGLGYPELLTQLVEIALDRHDRKSRLVRDFEGAV